MESEFDIMLNIYGDLICNLDHIKNSHLKMVKNLNKIKHLDNNYFDVKCDNELFKNYLNMFNDVNTYNELITNLETLKSFFEDKIKNRCEHEWTDDLIDIDPDRAEQICYCVKCEVTKR